MSEQEKGSGVATAPRPTKRIRKKPGAIVKVAETDILDPQSANPMVLETRIQQHEATRKVLTDFISRNMKEGQDYGKISLKKRDGTLVESKNTLFKPGSEKFCSLFGLRPTFTKDMETWEMLGSKIGIVAYVCHLTTKNDVVVGEGRGVADVTEREGWSANNAVKIAQKRAQIDAVLRSGGLSDFFTQDLEDEAETDPKTGKKVIDESAKITKPQMNLIFTILKKAGKTKEAFEDHLLKTYGVIGIENTPRRVASQLIDTMIGKGRKAEPTDLPSINLDDEKPEQGA
jgi:hypothetical protein